MSHFTNRLVLSVLTLMLSSISPLCAKWATFEDAPTRIPHYQEKITIHRDGTYESRIEQHREILNDNGRKPFHLDYNADSEKIEVEEAKTIYDGQEYNVDSSAIEDNEIASNLEGFDRKKQILISFPKAEVGATLCIKYKRTVTTVPLEHFFSRLQTFGDGNFIAHANIEINSEIPLHMLVNDPENALEIVKDKDDGFCNIKIKLTKPLFTTFLNEPETSVINNKYYTWVSLSTLDKWEDLVIAESNYYAQISEQELPEDFVKILDEANKKTTALDQINTVTSLLIDKITYMGDWRSVSGRFRPRDLREISETQYGDCKDFSAATAAILTKLGYKAHIVFVMRGVGEFFPDSLPTLAAFNHAMVRATDKDGRVYWVDPTNSVSMADGIFPDIAGKMTLATNAEHPVYEGIPDIDPHHAQIIWQREIEMLPGGNSRESGSVTFVGEQAFASGLTGSMLRASKKAIEDSLYHNLAGKDIEERDKKNMTLPDLRSRFVKDITFGYSVENVDGIIKTNISPAIRLKYPSLGAFFDLSQDCVADALMSEGGPHTLQRQTIIKGIVADGVEQLNKELKTPWLYIKRQVNFNQDGDLRVDETITIYKTFIASEDFKKPEFINLKRELRAYPEIRFFLK